MRHHEEESAAGMLHPALMGEAIGLPFLLFGFVSLTLPNDQAFWVYRARSAMQDHPIKHDDNLALPLQGG
jgi:hypothetical protein